MDIAEKTKNDNPEYTNILKNKIYAILEKAKKFKTGDQA